MTRGSAEGIAEAAAPRFGLGACLLAAFLLLAACPHPAAAQTDPGPRLVVAETLAVPLATAAPLRIAITPVSAVPRNAFVRIRGLPPMAALSDGHSIAPGAWAVSLASLADLRITVPAGAQARSALTVTLVSVEGAVITEVQTTLVAGVPPPPAPPAAPPRAPAAAEQSAAVAPDIKTAPPSLKPEDRERALRLLKRGQQLLEDTNIAEARLLFEKAADLGLADGAIALAATFDEAELAKSGVRGVRADAKEARRWYERAAQLGAREAQQRLQRLGTK